MDKKINCIICDKETSAKRIGKKYCRECLKKKAQLRKKKYLNSSKGKEVTKSYSKRYYRENAKKCRESSKIWANNNEERRNENLKRFKERNPNYFKEWNKKNWQINKEKEQQRTREYHQKNRGEILKKLKEYRKQNKDYFKEKWKEYYKINKKKLLQRKKIWNEKNKEHNKIVRTKYYLSPRGKEIMSHNNRLRKIRKRNAIHNFSLGDWKNKVEKTWGICPMCNKIVGIENMTLDHIFPISKVPVGFVYEIEDVQPLCHNCNSSKNNKINENEMKLLIESSTKQGLI